MNFLYPVENLNEIKSRYIKYENVFRKGMFIIENEMCTFTSGSGSSYSFTVEDRFDDFKVDVRHQQGGMDYNCSCGTQLPCCPHAAAALVTLYNMYRDSEALAGWLVSRVV